ncbi:MAG TPA: peptidyl-prolyl cis-trans isomerase [Candidatus Sericytochromatia bacterium]
MVSQPFLAVDEQPISLAQALQYLQASGKLTSFIGDILRQYVIEQELQNREDLEISPALTEQAVIDFRLQRQLTDPKVFAEWLASTGKDYTTFHKEVTFSFKQELLKTIVTEPKLQEHFIERKLFLDRVVLSRISVSDRELAEELATQVEEGASFDQLANEYSLSDDRIVNGMMGPISRGTLPDPVRAAIDVASPGAVIGPLELEGSWVLFRVGQILPASLEDIQLRQALQNELFEQWVAQKIQKMTVKLQVA